MTRSICFATNEIYPLHRGGIGRFIYNIFETYKGKSDIYIILYGQNIDKLKQEKRDELKDRFGKNNIFFIDDYCVGPRSAVVDASPLQQGETLDWILDESFALCRALLHIMQVDGIRFDTIEFLDLFAPAFHTLQAKLTGEAFADTRISVRLHSAKSIIAAHERNEVSLTAWHSKLFDIERKALRDADLVVGHLATVVEANRRFYGFDESWLQRTAVNIPPVVLDPEVENDTVAAGANGCVPQSDGPVFVFSSRIEAFKQPILFIEAAKMYLRRGGNGTFILACYGFDQDYIDWVLSHIPSDLSGLIVHKDDLSEADRLGILRSGIACIPSSYESYCFFAYECLSRGSAVIVNSACAAFDESTFWEHETNCLKFDGSISGLCAAFEQASTGWLPHSAELPKPTEEPYWRHCPEATSSSASLAGHKRRTTRLTVLVFGCADETVSVAELVAGGPPCADPVSVRRVGEDVLDYNCIYDLDAIREVLEASDFVAFCPDGMLLSNAFCERALWSLETHADLFGVVPSCMTFGKDGLVAHFRGDAPVTALCDIDRVGLFGAVLRKSALDCFGTATREVQWWRQRMLARLIFDDKRLAVVPFPEFAAYISQECLVRTLTPPQVQSGLRQEFEPIYWQSFALPLVPSEIRATSEQISHLERELGFAAAMCEERLATIQEMDSMIAERDARIEQLQHRQVRRTLASLLSAFKTRQTRD